MKGFLSENFSGFPIRSLPYFAISFIAAAVMAFLLSRIYVKYGTALSNRRAFGRNFVLLAVTTMFIITVVKSSLALSLGLVGALSIVRFRAAIKEPEELVYLFLTIAIGLGCGSGFTILTVVAFCGFSFFIWLGNRYKRETSGQSLYLRLSTEQSELNPDSITKDLSQFASSVKLKRLDSSNGRTEMNFLVEFESLEGIHSARIKMSENYPGLAFSIMDTSRDF